MFKRKGTEEEQIRIVKACAEGILSQKEAAQQLGIVKTTVQYLVARYKAKGILEIRKEEKNTVYTKEVKKNAVIEYLSGNESQVKIAAKYGLRSTKQLRNWIKVYNSGKDFSRKMSGGSRMKQGRETSQEERIKIARECLEKDCNYGEIALKYKVSYQQVYSWVKKYKELGAAGLEDRRGKRLAEQDPRTELEKAQIEIAQLKHRLYMAEMERDLLKKLDEIERRESFRR